MINLTKFHSKLASVVVSNTLTGVFSVVGGLPCSF